MNSIRESSASRDAYRCLACSGSLHEGETEYCCTACARTYPIVGGIPVLRHRPHAVIAGAEMALRDAWSKLDQARHGLAARSVYAEKEPTFAPRARRMIAALDANLSLVRAYTQPLAEYLRGHGASSLTALDWLAAYARGWHPESMLAYFYQDWGGTPAFAGVRSLLLDALRRQAPDRDALLVLGAGAGGIVHAGASQFETTYGLDLSLPTLLIARGVLAGDSFVVHMPSALWRQAQVTGASVRHGHTRLAVADAAVLPLADGSMSAVITQCLMDVLGNPLVALGEIARVLKPSGVWINFSNPFTVPGEPTEFGPTTLDELPALVEPFGLEIRERERVPFAWLDVSALDPAATAYIHEIHFVVAAREPRPRPGLTHASRGSDARESEAEWWRRIPMAMPGRDVRLVHDRLTPGGSAVRQDSVLVRVGGTIVSVPSELAQLIEAFFAQLDGSRALEDIFAGLPSNGARPRLDRDGFREFVTHLHAHHGVIDLLAPAMS